MTCLEMHRGKISISDLRTLARSLGEPEGDGLLDAIRGAENLRLVHREDCGCDHPGAGSCEWPRPEGLLLAAFEFDEIVIAWP